MSRYYESSAALCPYYRGEIATAVFCEGTEAGSTIRLAFPGGRPAKEHKCKYCRADWQACRLAAAHETK